MFCGSGQQEASMHAHRAARRGPAGSMANHGAKMGEKVVLQEVTGEPTHGPL
jgi:hypothetical protein